MNWRISAHIEVGSRSCSLRNITPGAAAALRRLPARETRAILRHADCQHSDITTAGYSAATNSSALRLLCALVLATTTFVPCRLRSQRRSFCNFSEIVHTNEVDKRDRCSGVPPPPPSSIYTDTATECDICLLFVPSTLCSLYNPPTLKRSFAPFTCTRSRQQ
eukprot:1196032-Prorocentrum_minimum.AAC.2